MLNDEVDLYQLFKIRGFDEAQINAILDVIDISGLKEQTNHEEMCGIHDGYCYVCGQKTNSYAGFPGEWSVFLPHIDGQKKHRYYHVKCLYPILREMIK